MQILTDNGLIKIAQLKGFHIVKANEMVTKTRHGFTDCLICVASTINDMPMNINDLMNIEAYEYLQIQDVISERLNPFLKNLK